MQTVVKKTASTCNFSTFASKIDAAELPVTNPTSINSKLAKISPHNSEPSMYDFPKKKMAGEPNIADASLIKGRRLPHPQAEISHPLLGRFNTYTWN